MNLIFLLFSLTHAQSHIEQLVGKTFNYPGPNCFGVALHATGINPIIRAVDLEEFKSVLKYQCQQVETPRLGDLGVYSMKGFEVIHAFYYVSEDLVLEKTGVDYLGKTPIYLREHYKSYHTFGYSQECVRYGGKDDPRCYNDLTYYRCEDLEAVTPEEITILENSMDFLLEKIMNGETPLKKKDFDELAELVVRYETAINHFGSEFQEILKGRLISYQKQVKFLKPHIK